MAESANTLFHFTAISKLKGILKNGFHPKYYLENLANATPYASNEKEWHVPMVCFCDLPLSRIRKHIAFYGEYGIGLRKEGWGIERGISPIIYLPEVSYSSISFRSMSEETVQSFYKYIKAYKGKSFNKRRRKEVDITFYHEREWRFVPEKFSVISKNKGSKRILDAENAKLKEQEHKLGCKAEDVKYIIVKTEKEIPKFAEFIQKRLKKVFEKEDDRSLLVSKLISAEQIKEDM